MDLLIPVFNCSLEEGPTKDQAVYFSRWLWAWYAQHRRTFFWREHISSYQVFVSEVMLQQTQTKRVAEKLPVFLERFGSFEQLAAACNADILLAWQGFGYNRRALYIRDAARKVVEDFDGRLPDAPDLLQTLPGIGPATAASICAYAYDKPVLFVETNIRTVLLYVFFSQTQAVKVSDRVLLELMGFLLPEKNFRDWYYALTDLGVCIKKQHGNYNRKSAAYTKQSRFEGSRRQVRGKVLKMLLALPYQSIEDLAREIERPYEIVAAVVNELHCEGHIQQQQGVWFV